MNPQNKITRVDYIDAARGFAMLSIIAGHMGLTSINRFVFTYHVPIFFVISGYFYTPKKKQNAYIKLIKPYIFTVFCLVFLELCKQFGKIIFFGKNIEWIKIAKIFIAGLYGSGSRHDFLYFHLPVIGAIWFYLALLWIMFFFSLIYKQKSIFYYFSSVILWIIGYYSAKMTWLPLSIQSGFCGMIFFIIGILVREKNLIEIYLYPAKDNNRYVISLTMLAVFIILWGVDLYLSYVNGNMSLVKAHFPNPLFNIIGAVASSWVIIFISKLFEKARISKLFQFFGKNTIIVLSFHLIEMNLPFQKLLKLFPVLSTHYLLYISILFFMKILWCYLGIFVTHKMKILRFIFSMS